MIRVVRLGSARLQGEGTRLGTVRRPPRGVPKARHAADGWYDAWLPVLAPSAALLRRWREEQAAAIHADADADTDDRRWAGFARRYRAEMRAAAPRDTIALLAALSQAADFSVGCYCADARRCHRSLLAGLLADAGARMAG